MSWTDPARHQYARTATRYTTDLTDAEFALIAPPSAWRCQVGVGRSGVAGCRA